MYFHFHSRIESFVITNKLLVISNNQWFIDIKCYLLYDLIRAIFLHTVQNVSQFFLTANSISIYIKYQFSSKWQLLDTLNNGLHFKLRNKLSIVSSQFLFINHHFFHIFFISSCNFFFRWVTNLTSFIYQFQNNCTLIE